MASQLLSYFFINFSLIILPALTETLFFSSIVSLFMLFPFCQNKCNMVEISLIKITI